MNCFSRVNNLIYLIRENYKSMSHNVVLNKSKHNITHSEPIINYQQSEKLSQDIRSSSCKSLSHN